MMQCSCVCVCCWWTDVENVQHTDKSISKHYSTNTSSITGNKILAFLYNHLSSNNKAKNNEHVKADVG